MRLRSDTQAASPLVVITTFVLAAILLTAGAYALFFDRPEPRLQFVLDEQGETPSLRVTHAGGGLEWQDVTLRLLDRAGTDQASAFLQPPSGEVDKGDVVALEPRPPSGTYLLLVLEDGDELSRLVIDI